MSLDFNTLKGVAALPAMRRLSDVFGAIASWSVAFFGVLIVFRMLEVIPAWGYWYSPNDSIRLQAMAFLDGHLNVGDSILGPEIDWIWSKSGVHQNWNLGAPFLVAVFEGLCRLLGGGFFPDRFVLAMLAATAVEVLRAGVRNCLEAQPCPPVDCSPRHQSRLPLEISALVAAYTLVFAHPLIFTLTSLQLRIYEETSLYAVFFTLMTVGVVWLEIQKPSFPRFVTAALLCGSCCFFRSSLALTGAVFFLTMLLSNWKRYWWRRALAAASICATGPLFHLLFNYLRFDSPWSFGFELTMHSTWVGLFQIFGSPTGFTHGLATLSEVFALTFLSPLSNGCCGFNGGWEHPLVTSALRFREIYGGNFGLVGLVTLGFAAAALVTRAGKHEGRFVCGHWLCLAGGLTFLLTFLLYVRLHYFATRYLADALPAFVAVQAGLLSVWVKRLYGRRRRLLPLFGAAALLLYAVVAFPKKEGEVLADLVAFPAMKKEEVRARLNVKMQKLNAPFRPSEFSRVCPEPVDAPALPFVNVWDGWYMGANCHVGPLLVTLVPRSRCVELDFDLELWQPFLSDYDPLEQVAVKRGYVSLRLEKTAENGSNRVMTFCVPEDRLDDATEHLAIGWINPFKLRHAMAPVRLNRISAVEVL